MNYIIFEKRSHTAPGGKVYIVAGPEEYGIKLSARQEGWKKVATGLSREEAYAQQAARNAKLK